MASTYPTTLDTLATNKTNATAMANDHAAHHDDMADAINKIERNVQAVFNVKGYGAVGDGTTDDTAAFQAAATAAIAVGGKLLIPNPGYNLSYKITSQINLVPPGGNSQFHLDIEAVGDFPAIFYTGLAGSIFKSYGWKRSTITGLQIRVASGKNGVVAWDIDHDSTRSSTGILEFNRCSVTANPNVTNCVGWRFGHSLGAEYSFIQFNTCSVEWGSSPKTGNVGWVMEQNNGLVMTWVDCATTDCVRGWTTTQTAGAAMTAGGSSFSFIGCGASNNDADFELHPSDHTIIGGRYEVGKRFLSVPNSSVSGITVIRDVEISSYAPGDGIVFYYTSPGTLLLDGVSVNRYNQGTDHTSSMITMSTGTGRSTLIARGCNFPAPDPFYTDSSTLRSGIHLKANNRQNPTNGVWIAKFKDRENSAEGVLNVLTFGAVGDGVADDTTAIQAALNAVPATGATLYFPPGVYLVAAGGLTCSNPVTLLGSQTYQSSSAGSVVTTTATNATLFSFSAPGTALRFMQFHHASSGTRSAGLIGVSMTNSNFNRIESCMFTGFSTNLKIDTGIYYTISHTAFRDFVLRGLDLKYTGSPDAGDPSIDNCNFDRTGGDTTQGGTAIYLSSVAGVKIDNVKINGKSGANGFDYGVLHEQADTLTSTILQITGGSIEGVKTAAVAATLAGGATTGSLLSFQVTGAELNGLNNAGSIGVLINGPTVNALSVTGNTFNLLDQAVSLKNVTGGTVSGNSSRGLITRGVTLSTGNGKLSIGGNDWDIPTGTKYATPIVVARTVDSTSITSNTTLANDDTLQWPMAKDDRWFFEAWLLVNAANATMDINFGWAVPTNATLLWGIQGSGAVVGWGPQAIGGSPTVLQPAANTVAVGTNTGTIGVPLAGIITGDGTNSGTVALKWAQNTSDPGALKLLAGSFLRMIKVS
jgi:hypothetical protein